MSRQLGVYKIKTKTGDRYRAKWRRPDGSQTSKTFRTRKEADDHKRSIDSQKSRGRLPDDRRTKVKFEELAQQVFACAVHAPSTVRRRQGIMNKHLLPALKGRRVSDISRHDIQSLINSWERQGLAARSITNHMNVLRPIFNTAVIDEIIDRSPLTGLRVPKPRKARRNPLTPQQCAALLRAVDPTYASVIHFALATGARFAEIAKLTIRDFKPLLKEVHIHQSKTAAGDRRILLDDEDVARIARHLEDSGRTGADADSPLFTSPEGKRLDYSNFRERVFVPACRAAGLDGVTFHDLRRTHATMLVAEGHDPKVVQDRMGHESISTTLTYYAAATDDGKKKAAGAKDRYLGQMAPSSLRDAQ